MIRISHSLVVRGFSTTARTARARPSIPGPSSPKSSPSHKSTPSTSVPSQPRHTISPREPSHPKPWSRPEPPLVAAARAKTVKQRNVFESYLVLDPKIRLYFWLGTIVFALVGLYGGDYLVPDATEKEDGESEIVDGSK
ncbi:hypothetical protein T439DRAFT_383425 [Meredithblackwellia eburnea MCA 4105]